MVEQADNERVRQQKESQLPAGTYPSLMAEYIFERLFPFWKEEYLEKNSGYPELDPHELGPAAEFVEIHRKTRKLKHKFWDELELGPEDEEQVIRDMIGHCFQLLYIIRMTSPVVVVDSEKTVSQILDEATQGMDLSRRTYPNRYA